MGKIKELQILKYCNFRHTKLSDIYHRILFSLRSDFKKQIKQLKFK